MIAMMLAAWFASGAVGGGVTALTGESSPAATRSASPVVGSTPWYDPASDRVVPIPVETVSDDSVHRESRWLPQPRRVRQSVSPGTSGGGSGIGTGTGGWFGTGLTLGNLVGWALLAAILVTTVGLLVYMFSRADFDGGRPAGGRRESRHEPDEQTLMRMKELPDEVRGSGGDLRAEAMRWMESSRFDLAMISLFGHQLLLLDRVGVLRLARGKTNGRYVREAYRNDRDLGERLAMTVADFERSYFGRHPINADRFAELWANNLEIERALDANREVAA